MKDFFMKLVTLMKTTLTKFVLVWDVWELEPDNLIGVDVHYHYGFEMIKK